MVNKIINTSNEDNLQPWRKISTGRWQPVEDNLNILQLEYFSNHPCSKWKLYTEAYVTKLNYENL